jgi:hypothetical protein
MLVTLGPAVWKELGENDDPIFAKLPSREALQRLIGPSVQTYEVTDNGLMIRTRGTLPVMGLGLPTLLPVWSGPGLFYYMLM